MRLLAAALAGAIGAFGIPAAGAGAHTGQAATPPAQCRRRPGTPDATSE